MRLTVTFSNIGTLITDTSPSTPIALIRAEIGGGYCYYIIIFIIVLFFTGPFGIEVKNRQKYVQYVLLILS